VTASSDRVDRPSPVRIALESYRIRFGWPVFTSGDAVWLRLTGDMAAISILPPTTARLGASPDDNARSGPVIQYPNGRLAVLTRCLAAHCPHGINDSISDTLAHLGCGECIDLPPTRMRGGVVRWLHRPLTDTWPECVDVIETLRPWSTPA
jgi:hypothetical protein